MKLIKTLPLNRNARTRAFVLAALALLLLPAGPASAQPREERLLNGLKIVFFQRSGDPKVWLKLRVHSGAAFDLAGREGMTQLLTDALFPDPSTRSYVAEELGGRLDVRTTYDAVDITLEGNAAEFDRLVELLRNAFLQMRLTPEEVRRLKDARLKSAKEAETTAALADRAADARLFGGYPYGRTVTGTAESLTRVERADLMLARERFHIPNHATLVVVGNLDRERAMRVLRQFLGPWRKGDTVAPATFRQPDAPDARALILDAPGAAAAEVRVALRGLARTDRDHASAALLAHVARARWQDALKEYGATSVSVTHDPRALAGLFRMSASVPAPAARQAVESAHAVLRSLAAAQVSAAELERGRRDHAAAAPPPATPELALADEWLDSVTYNLDAAEDARRRAAAPPTAADLQRVAARLFKDAPQATVVAGPASELRAALASLPAGIEVVSERPPAQPAAKPAAAPQPAPPAARRP